MGNNTGVDVNIQTNVMFQKKIINRVSINIALKKLLISVMIHVYDGNTGSLKLNIQHFDFFIKFPWHYFISISVRITTFTLILRIHKK